MDKSKLWYYDLEGEPMLHVPAFDQTGEKRESQAESELELKSIKLQGLEAGAALPRAPAGSEEAGFDVIGNSPPGDWISLIFRYRDTSKEKNISVTFVDTYLTSTKSRNPSHQTVCKLSDYPDRDFPSKDDYPNGVVPAFPNKRLAKTFAARCAVEFLVSEGKITWDRMGFTHPSAYRTSLRQSRVHDEVVQLCKRLSHALPRYVLTSTGNNLFSGHADFGPDGGGSAWRGSVVDTKGEKHTKRLLAVQVVDYLRQVEAGDDQEMEDGDVCDDEDVLWYD